MTNGPWGEGLGFGFGPWGEGLGFYFGPWGEGGGTLPAFGFGHRMLGLW